MTTTATAPNGRRDTESRSRSLDRAVAAMSTRRRAEVEVLESVLAFAHESMVAPGSDDAAMWRSDTVHAPGSPGALFGEQLVPLAGPGAPLVAEFAPMELAAVLDVSHEAALALVGDVLDLAHRLPRLWALVRDLRVPVHMARRAAQESRDLSVDAADHADRLLVWQPRRLNPHRVGVLVHEARLYADPDRAVADHDAALETRRVDVRLGQGAPGTGEVFMILDEADALALDRTVTTMAATAGALGHPGSVDVRRAHAAGLLADPQRALDLMAAADSDPDRLDDDPRTCAAEDSAHASSTPFGRGAGEAVIVLHVTDRDLLTGGPSSLPGRDGVARSAALGPVLMERLAGWLVTAGKITVTPVLDVTTIPAVDPHDPPSRMAEAVRLRDETCVYPRCGRPSTACDLDHIEPYVPMDQGGPPGQTRPDSLAPLCRRHHRAKTFGEFTYRRRADGAYEWTMPTGLAVTTDPPHRRPTPPR
jgi:hypothetical protein